MNAQMQKIAQIVVARVKEEPNVDVKTLVSDVVEFMRESNLLSAWRELEGALDEAWRNEFGASKVKVITAHELSARAKEAITKQTRGADLEVNVDDSIIGGAIIRIDDRRIDGSLKGKINNLKRTLS